MRGEAADPTRPTFSSAEALDPRHADRRYRLDNDRRIQSVRAGDWKLIRYPGAERDYVELYDLRTDRGEGRIVIRGGLVHGATLTGIPGDLCAALVGAGLVSKRDFEAAQSEASANDEEVDAVLIRRDLVDRVRLDAACRDCVEFAAIRLLAWNRGDCGELDTPPHQPAALELEPCQPKLAFAARRAVVWIP